MRHIQHDFCCDSMFEAIEEDKIIDYDITVRDYGILVGKNSIRILLFCPWCGMKLPKRLMKEFYEILESEYGMEDVEIVKDDFAHVPEEFKTDKWWKKRGL